jgi:hypothetical protein
MQRERNFFNIFKILATIMLVASSSFAARANDIETDVQDPLFLNRKGDFVSRSIADVGDYFQARQSFSYGFSDKFALSADVRYRLGDDDRRRNGWNGVGVTGTYRVGQGQTGVTDVIFGVGYDTHHGVIPNYADETYRIGFRTGRQWNMVTLSGTVMTNWIFHPVYGQAYIDLTPEAYFRMQHGWSMGFGATVRRSTNVGAFNQNWLNYMVGSTIGRTGWFFTMGYELNDGDFRLGGTINMLF